MSQNVADKRMWVEVVEAPPIVPVTALHFTSRYLLSGEGSYCHLYELNTWKHVAVHRIFATSSVHGIRPEVVKTTGLICFFGVKSLRVVSFDDKEESDHRTKIGQSWSEVLLDDWIWDCAWIWKEDEEETNNLLIAAVLGHNSVVQVDFKSGSTLKHVQCQESCILYSARLMGRTWHDLMVAVGTVFNQVVLWSVNGPVNELGQAEVMHVLKGHQGVVMGVDFDSRHRQICSVSDDRSIRVWQVATPSDGKLLNGKNRINNADIMNTNEWRMAEFRALHVLYGHAARVWDAKILADGYVSVGEDATCCLWDFSGQVTQKFKGHQGKSIWSLAVSTDESLLATGGGDSSLRIWRRSSAHQLSDNVSIVDIAMPQSLQDGDFPRVVKLLNSSVILVMTNKGRLLRHDTLTGQWTVVMDNASYASYSVITPGPCRSMVAIGNISGWLKLLVHHSQDGLVESLEQQLYTGKVHSIVWLTGVRDCFLTSGPGGQMFVWRVCTAKEPGKRSLMQLSELVLPPGKQRWVTSACLVLHATLLVCGDREGGLHVYRGSNPDVSAMSFESQPCQTFSRVHGSSEVSELSYHGGQVYTCGRDGYYRVYAVTTDQRLQLLHSCRVLKGLDWLSQLIFYPQDILVLGFHSDQFIAYSTSTNQCLFAVPCGGGHRAWDFTMSEDECFLVYIKQRGIAFYRTKMMSHQHILSPSLHGREVTCIRHLVSRVNDSGVQHFVATAGEDGRLILLSISESKTENNEEFLMSCISPTRVVASTQVPASSLRAIGVSRRPSSDRSHSSVFSEVLSQLVIFSGGSKGQIIVWKPHVTNSTTSKDNFVKLVDDLKMSNNDFTTPGDYFTTPSEDFASSGDGFWEFLASQNLCVKGRKRLKPWKEHLYSPEVETRYMDISAFCLTHLDDRLPSHLHLVVAVCSSGVLRVFVFDEKCRVFHLVASSSCHGHCLLKVKHFFCPSKSDGVERKSVYVLSAGTDGRIALWNITQVVLSFCWNQFPADKTGVASDVVSAASDNGNVGDASTNVRGHVRSPSDTKQEIFGDQFKCLGSGMPFGDNTAISDNTELLSSFASHKKSSANSKVADASKTSNGEAKLVKRDSFDSISGNLSGENSSSEASYSLSSEEEEEESEDSGKEDCHNLTSSVGDLGKPAAVLEVHQSGINALDVKQLSADQNLYALASGGDDNALHLHVLDLSDGATVRSVHHDVNASAHAAQITGICFLDETILVSASIDQRLTFWTFQDDQSLIKLKALKTVYTDVADVAELEIWDDKYSRFNREFRLAVSGIGLQCFKAQI